MKMGRYFVSSKKIFLRNQKMAKYIFKIISINVAKYFYKFDKYSRRFLMRNYDILILGIESNIGQRIWTIIKQDFSFLSVAVPMSKYSNSIEIPNNQVRLDFNKDQILKNVISSFKIIIVCKNTNYNKIENFAKEQNVKFIKAYHFTPQIVIDVVVRKLGLNDLEIKQLEIPATSKNVFKFLFLDKKDFLPISQNGKKLIRIGEIHLSTKNINFYLTFSFGFTAYLFFILGIFLKLFILIKKYVFRINNYIAIPFNSEKDIWELVVEENPGNQKENQRKNQTQNQRKNTKKIEKLISLSPSQDETEIILNYLVLCLMNHLQLCNPFDKYNFNSLKIW
ncbi:hypothetical protein TRFO_12892 [Tritrichomonas foetus]|uniref:Uncharacterized protein n=1 Tax=Tritrichomonas foetus TaxID=1144522 RepID=A0A1J4KZY1_9EUKA|nr:hypothetical protein TRFO_12892 [Tritrichomonas foetus]|eukprot:OHT16815.1 hypothetical protein TRFO_12892 [Tritrichomonas foetus]